MTRMMLRRSATAMAMTLSLLFAAGCGLLDVSDPTAIGDDDLNDADGAALLRGDALRAFSVAYGSGAESSGLLADEFFSDPPNQGSGFLDMEQTLDSRNSLQYESQFGGGAILASGQQARRAASVAMAKLLAYGPMAHAGEMYALRGFVTVQLAEAMCPGFPLHDLNGLTVRYGLPLSTDEVFQRALADFDSAVAAATDSVRILNLARVGRGRTLLGLGQFAEAAAAVADVPTGYAYEAEYGGETGIQWNPLEPDQFGVSWGVSDREGINGLDYLSSNDPRVPTDSLRVRYDSVDNVRGPAIYPDENAPIVVASGVEARLIKAESELAGGGPWLATLNGLRTMPGGPGLGDTTDPGTPAARLDLLFRERAFWLFATGHRLGDMRRLIARYDRDAESVFPTGGYRLGGPYSTGTSIPFSAEMEALYSPSVTGCTSR